ncbi:MAG: hypothetical protein KGL39_36775 [Patescibacteria group bacterium]|nr:hypothetical protein [Patescibacteria group bacterium]
MLNAAAITELDVESATYAIFSEWLPKYFTGQPVVIGGNRATLPKAVIAFGQSPANQPVNPVGTGTPPQAGITMVWGTPLSTSRKWETVNGLAQLMIYKKARWNFWVRVEMQSAQSANARKLCRQAAEGLSALMMNPATTYELGQKGIHHVRPSEPEPVSDTGYILMLVGCRAQLRYPVLVQPFAITQDNVRVVNGTLELWDAGQSAFVPLTMNNGTLGVGAPDLAGVPQANQVLALLGDNANVRLNNGVLELWDAGQSAFVPLTVNNGTLGVGAAT